MLSDILRLSDRNVDQLLDALSQGMIYPGASIQQIRKAGLTAHAQRIQAWMTEAMDQFGSIEGMKAAVRLLQEERARSAKASPGPELVLTGPEIEGVLNRDTRVVVREMFESTRRSVLIVGYAFHGSDDIFEPLAQRMAGNSKLGVCIIVNVHPKQRQSAGSTVQEFAGDFFRSSWPFSG